MTSDPSFSPLTGACQCGSVRFRMETAPIVTHCCHCRSCQKSSGSAFGLNAMIETDQLTLLSGQVQPAKGMDGHTVLRCPVCRLGLWSHLPQLGDAIAIVGVGVLDEGERLAPEAHYFTRSKHPWLSLPPGLPSFEEMGYPDKPSARTRIEAALAARAATP